MSLARLALMTLLGLCACREPTYVLVSISTGDLVVPSDVRSIRISATNPDEPSGTADAVFRTQDVVLCPEGVTAACSQAPVTMTLSPGPSRPATRVRVQVDAFDPNDMLVSSDASTFAFPAGEHAKLAFVLQRRCLMTRCAIEGRACGPLGGCVDLQPSAGGSAETPDLASLPPPPSPITRLALSSGNWISDAAGVGLLTPPGFTEVGDRIVAIIEDAEPLSTTAWSRVGVFGGTRSARVFSRVAGTDEASNQDIYRVMTRGGRTTSTYRFLIYRSAGALRPTFDSGAMQSRLVFPSINVARDGSVLSSLVNGNGCPDPTILMGDSIALFERTVSAGSTGDLVLSCTAPAAQVQYLLEPL